jgi:5'-nucleotidase
VDLVVCLSHSGIDGQGGGEDVDLAQAVPGIDVIVSGHTHRTLDQPLKVGQTLIVIAGEHGTHLGKLALRISPEGEVQLKGYELITIDDTIVGHASVQQTIEGYVQALDTLLQPAGLAYDQVLAETSFDLTYPPFQEGNLGDLITDAYRAVVDALQPGEPVVLAFEANGVIWDPVRKGSTGELRFADLYGALPMGIGPDQQPGYPLVTFYLTGNEIKQGLELLANAQDVLADNDYFLQVSGVTVEVDPAGPPFDRVTSVVRDDGSTIDLTDTSTCHKVATNYFLATALQLVSLVTAGAITVVPREADCQTPVAEMATRIVDLDPTSDGIQELKQWQALIQYLALLPDVDGNSIPDIPASYATAQGRIVTK